MLEDAEEDGFSNLVSWLPCGKKFRVHCSEEFAQSILPQYFNQNRYKSFQRQLNIYGFERIVQGKEKGAYAHKYFVRGSPDLCRFMTRTKIKGNRTGTTASTKIVKQENASSSLFRVSQQTARRPSRLNSLVTTDSVPSNYDASLFPEILPNFGPEDGQVNSASPASITVSNVAMSTTALRKRMIQDRGDSTCREFMLADSLGNLSQIFEDSTTMLTPASMKIVQQATRRLSLLNSLTATQKLQASYDVSSFPAILPNFDIEEAPVPTSLGRQRANGFYSFAETTAMLRKRFNQDYSDSLLREKRLAASFGNLSQIFEDSSGQGPRNRESFVLSATSLGNLSQLFDM